MVTLNVQWVAVGIMYTGSYTTPKYLLVSNIQLSAHSVRNLL